jgi:hypothetical protein
MMRSSRWSLASGLWVDDTDGSGEFVKSSITGTLSTVSAHLYTPCACLPRRPTPTVSLVSQTPIYDQLRGERINADVPATGADPHRVGYPGKHHLPPGVPSVAAVFGRPAGARSGLALNQHYPVAIADTALAPLDAARRAESAAGTSLQGQADPADQPVDHEHGAVAVSRPRAVLPSAVHAR